MKKTLWLLLLSLPLTLIACGDSGNASLEEVPTELAADQNGTEAPAHIVDGIKVPGSAQLKEDLDSDLIPDESDNCPTISNWDQTDSNEDGIGDACSKL
jgi:hypothetical protein